MDATIEESPFPFLARLNLPENKPPVRAYVHRAGLRDAFGSETRAKDYFNEQLSSYLNGNLSSYNFAIAVLWGSFVKPGKINNRGQTSYRHIDVFGFHGLNDNWQGNPDISNFVMTNGIFTPLEKPSDITTCGDSLILLAAEEEYRRTTPNLDFFMRNPPNLGGLLA